MRRFLTVYPRVRGGTIRRRGGKGDGWGLSPRARGNLVQGACKTPLFRSIPACAGEPTQSSIARRLNGVYPRVRGGTCIRTTHRFHREGLSPRARGNLGPGRRFHLPIGSIPACAGEPRSGSYSHCERTVYPRVRGGTTRSTVPHFSISGLSPRARGNHRAALLVNYRRGSIPACAGEPSCAIPIRSPTSGLSPRARGNRIDLRPLQLRLRSIPACAGEPRTHAVRRSRRTVYPRVRGGTVSVPLHHGRGEGLSPRARGNPASKTAEGRMERSIPACAGEPPWIVRHRLLARVYPRVRGGTTHCSPIRSVANGLSPRARGNLKSSDSGAVLKRSIPACAGEPLRPRRPHTQ